MKIILQECDLWELGLKGFYDNKNILLENPKYCTHHILAVQKDFLNQKLILQEVIESLRYKVIFYPKFHCVLNYIKMYWRAAK